ncbi:MAG: DUF983 domain-containing protein [Daejeonella sp.]|uniref:DUF983 domain-containing protein n=1 Tax=Daejeonella sp. JGW-45 TaxID=3034148 RepID=UPI0023EC89B6|nr:DUF983 domain-containing protein [Daejeonella sp. JGW-45]
MKLFTEKKEDHRISQLYALVNSKCPRCRRGDVFQNSMYGFRAQKMNENCPHCNLKFEREPGYFYVAMFVSYGFNVAQMIIAGLLTYFITHNSESPWLYMAVIFPVVVVLAPFNYRYSRLILLYYLTPGLHYVPEMSRDKKVKTAI